MAPNFTTGYLEAGPGNKSSKRLAALLSTGTACLVGIADVFAIVYGTITKNFDGIAVVLASSATVIGALATGAWAAFRESTRTDALDVTTTTRTEPSGASMSLTTPNQ